MFASSVCMPVIIMCSVSSVNLQSLTINQPESSSSMLLLVNVTLTLPVVLLKLVILKVIGCFLPL